MRDERCERQGKVSEMAARRHGISVLLLMAVLLIPHTGFTAVKKPIRIGYLDNPGALLVVQAATYGFYDEQGIRVILVPFRDSHKGLAKLDRRKLDAGAFSVGETLKRIAAGSRISIIAGGGRNQQPDQLADLKTDDVGKELSQGIVLAVSTQSGASGKELQVRLVKALILAHRALANRTSTGGAAAEAVSLHLDPNPDFWKLQQLWTYHGLQNETMTRDFLANHVNEEIYCDALDELLDEDGRKDPVLLKLNSRAVCVPDCCPAKPEKKR